MNTKIYKYLVGNNKSLIGTIVRISKAPNPHNPLDLSYSALLYYDHRTARIERYLFNPDVNLFNKNYNHIIKIGEDISNKDIKIYNQLKIYNINKLNHNRFESILVNRLDQGKLNINFYTIFLCELINNYLYSKVKNNCYINPDMNLIKILNENQYINYIPEYIDKNNLINNKLTNSEENILKDKYLI